MDWKVPGKFFRSLNITDRKMFYISFWSFWLHVKTCKKNFWKILIFCWGFSNVFESGIALGKVGVATILLVPRPCNHQNLTITSLERSTESFIKISSLVLKIFNILCFRFLFLKQKSAIIGTEWANDGWLLLFQEVLKIGNVEYF